MSTFEPWLGEPAADDSSVETRCGGVVCEDVAVGFALQRHKESPVQQHP